LLTRRHSVTKPLSILYTNWSIVSSNARHAAAAETAVSGLNCRCVLAAVGQKGLITRLPCPHTLA